MSDFWVRVLELAMFVPAIVLHEVSHGYVSYKLGDPTAKSRGRLSLNPIKHVDPFGTLVLPLLLWLSGAPIFGYAKPVPIDPRYYRDYRKGMFLTGLAGPTTNLTLALVAGIVVRLLSRGVLVTGTEAAPVVTVLGWVWYALYFFAQINLVLMFFNLIPIPPLDGSSVLPLFLSNRALYTYYRLQRYAFPVLIALLWGVPALFQVDPIGAYFRHTVDPLFNLLVPGR